MTFLGAPLDRRLVLALFAGLVALALLNPPMQVPDEPHHVFRAVQLARFEGKATKDDKTLGGRMGTELIEFSQGFGYLAFHPETRVNAAQVWRGKIWDGRFRLRAQDHMMNFPSTSMYSFTPYLPQIGGVWLGRAASLPVAGVFYLGRIMAAFAYAFGVAWLIGRTRDEERVALVAAAFFPMALFLAPSWSADGMSNLLAWATLVVTLDSLRRGLTARASPLLIVLWCCLALAKSVYFPLVAVSWLLLLTAPASNGSHWRMRIRDGRNWLALLFPGALSAAWAFYAAVDFVPLRSDVQVDPALQLKLVLAHPRDVWFGLRETFAGNFWPDMRLMLFGILGWLDAPIAHWFVDLAEKVIAVLWGLSLLRRCLAREFPPTWRDAREALRVGALSAAASGAVFLLIMLALLLTWTPVGTFKADGWQGRYFLPIFPWLLASVGSLFEAGLICIQILVKAGQVRLSSRLRSWSDIPGLNTALGAWAVCTYVATVLCVALRYWIA